MVAQTPQSSKTLTQTFGRFRSQLPYLAKAFGLVYQAAGTLTLVWLFLILAQGMLPVATVFLSRILVDGVADVIRLSSGRQGLFQLGPAAAVMVAVLILTEVLQGVAVWIRTAQSEKIQDHVQQKIHRQALTLDMSFYDHPGFYDQLHRARIDAISRPAALVENAGSLLQSFITLIAMAGVLLTFGFWIPLLLALSTLPALGVVFIHTLRFHQWRLKNTTAIRKTQYYDMMITSRDSAAEMRLFNLGSCFQDLFRGLRDNLRREKVRLARNEALSVSLAAMTGLGCMGASLAWMGYRASLGFLSLGDLALFAQAFFQGQRMMRSLLSNAGEIYRNIMFLENLFEFLALRPSLPEPDQPKAHPGLHRSIEFRNVTFRYPGSDRTALDCFSLDIPAGKITALVGENGAGKTTLIKLLCRFYDPTKGAVLVDETDLRDLSPEELRKHITVLFQDPVRYHDTVFNNIAFGDIHSHPDGSDVETAARAAGADGPINRLPGTYKAVLGKWFGGAELSGGEWQRLALARAFLRRADLVVLDEPTSAMDSWAEADWLARFRKLVRGRTALIITHRFTTAMQADIIHVMDRGKVVESGDHDSLIEAKGRYAESWMRQMRGKGGMAESPATHDHPHHKG